MAINTIETDIINTLKAAITDLQVEGYPEKPAEYSLIHPIGAILVAYDNSEFINTATNAGMIYQLENMRYSLTLMVRNLRDKNGAYAYIDTIKETLTGYAPTGCKKMYPANIAFLNERNSIWQYTMTFIVPTENYS